MKRSRPKETARHPEARRAIIEQRVRETEVENERREEQRRRQSERRSNHETDI